MKIELSKFNKFVDDKYISVQKHTEADLFIWNYTQKAQFDRVWTEETMMCRGLITDVEGNIVARPFKKFFNLDEAINSGEQIPLEDFEVTEKMDGSLGILYFINGKPLLATRGSFVSDQAFEGTKMLQGYRMYFDELNPAYTYLFEIIYPENRIVVDYGEMRDIVLLAVIETETGRELDIYNEYSGFPFVGRLNGITDITKLKELQQDNKEGFVIRFKTSGKRYKVKFDEYVRLHRLVTGVNARTIWDLLRNNQPFEELLDRVPDEFYSWVKRTKDDLKTRYDDVLLEHRKKFVELEEKYPVRKDFALAAKECKYPGILFGMLDGKDYEQIIWKLLKPTAERPFKEDEA